MKGLVDRLIAAAYASIMPTAQVQEEIIRALESQAEAISMVELLKQMQSVSVQSTAIRAAVLPLISVRRIELTPERKLRLLTQSR